MITRYWRKIASYAVDTSGNLSTIKEIPFKDVSAAMIVMPGSTSITTLTFYTAVDSGGTFVTAYDDAASPQAITLTVSASKSYPFPAKLFAAGAIKIVGDAAGTIDISLKG